MRVLRGLIIALFVALVFGGSVAASASTLKNNSQPSSNSVFVSNMIGIQHQMTKAPNE